MGTQYSKKINYIEGFIEEAEMKINVLNPQGQGFQPRFRPIMDSNHASYRQQVKDKNWQVSKRGRIEDEVRRYFHEPVVSIPR